MAYNLRPVCLERRKRGSILSDDLGRALLRVPLPFLAQVAQRLFHRRFELASIDQHSVPGYTQLL